MIKQQTISNKVKRKVASIPLGEVFTYRYFSGGPDEEQALAQVLSRLTRAGKLVRVGKGKYYKPVTTRFGTLRPSEAEVIKTLTQKGNESTGYLTGTGLYNRLGLTTQLSNVITIARNSRLPLKELKGYKIKFVIRAFKIKTADISLLQLLDAFTDIKRIPDTSPSKAIPVLVNKIKGFQDLQIKRMVQLAMNYPPSTRALLGAVIEYYFPTQATDKLSNSLNPMTRYRLDIQESILPNKAKWYFK
ncbi:DUF6088 family protein [Chitinophaga sp. MM2321]|uniref:DUF6088 family protein n=1 Tax=Chitinophaga sp. MM2321 TaxID=3137178 RepID=UPI0032D572C1